MHTLFLLVVASAASVSAITNYANEFIDPHFLVKSSAWSASTPDARENIILGANDLASQGPWSAFLSLFFLAFV